MECVDHLLGPKYLIISSLIIINTLSVHNSASAQQTDYIEAALNIQVVDVDLDFEGSIRTTQFDSLEFELREQLAENIEGTVHFGYLDVTQNSNPIFAGTNTTGGYLGFDLRWHLIKGQQFKLMSLFDYRYAFTDTSYDGQRIEWDWHQTSLALHSRTTISKNFSLGLGVSYLTINGVEKASGTLNQNLDFKAKDSLTGHIGLQLELDQDGQIGVELKTGSLQGGMITFQQSF